MNINDVLTSLLEQGFTYQDFINHYDMCLEEEDSELFAHLRHRQELYQTYYTIHPEMRPKKIKRVFKGQFANNRDKSNILKTYFITLTSGVDSPHAYLNAIKKILNYKCFKALNGYGCIELTKQGNPHSHIYLQTHNYVRLQKLKQCWKDTSIDIKLVKKDNGISKYIHKDAKNTKLLDYLQANNCERTYKI